MWDLASSFQISGSRREPTFNNRWWNDRRSWNLRTTNSREKASPKGANRIQSCSCSPPSGTIEGVCLPSAGSIPFGHSTRGYSHSPPSGTIEGVCLPSAGSIPFGHSTRGYSHSPPSGTVEGVCLPSAGSIPFGHSTSGYSHSPPSGTVEEKYLTPHKLS